ncbi:MAG: glycosyltransferase family 4 protein [Candidatus Acidiferrales bacterium]
MHLARGLAQGTSSVFLGTVELTVVTPISANGMNDRALPFKVVRQPNLTTLVRLLHRADVIHLAGPVFIPMILGSLLRKPVVIEHHGFQAICPNGQLLFEPTQEPCPSHFMAGRYSECIRCNSARGQLRSMKMWLLTFPRRWLCQHVAANILPTNWLGTLLQLNRMETIVHGIPPLETAAARGVSPSVPIFAFLGRLVSTKGVRVLLEAAQKLKAKGLAFRVKIIGQGPDRPALEKLARDLQVGDCVQFLGYIPVEQLDRSLADATAIVIPSLAGEVFGLVAAEEMQREKLVIVSDIGALAEVVGDSGLKFPPGDADALARCMESAITDPSLAERLGRQASHRIAQSFTVDRMANEHRRVYEELYRC